MKLSSWLATAAIVCSTAAFADDFASGITGTYKLYREGNMSKVVTIMSISGANGDRFKAGGVDQSWTSDGIMEGNDHGFYNWTLGDGTTGKTVIRIGGDGHLHGQVRGGRVNWDYVGVRDEGPVRIRLAKSPPAKKPAVQGLPQIACDPNAAPAAPGQSTQAIFHIAYCGGTDKKDVCCPPKNKFMNLCDCLCYPTSESIDCSRGYAVGQN